MFSLKNRNLWSSFLLLVLMNCSFSQKEPPSHQWPEMQFIVDGRVEIKLIVPPAKSEPGIFDTQSIHTSIGSLERLFLAFYDPGKGRDRDLLLTHIGSTIIHLKNHGNDKSNPSFESIKNDIYLAGEGSKRKFDFAGEVNFNNRPWLQVNLIGGSREGISYATIIDGGYALIVTMSIYGEKADQTRLFGNRHETLKTIVNSVQIYTE
jgi:hypothetical protein